MNYYKNQVVSRFTTDWHTYCESAEIKLQLLLSLLKFHFSTRFANS